MTNLTYLNLAATYTAQRFLGGGNGLDSDTYGVQANLGHAFTPRLTGIIGYGFTYLALQRAENSTTHTPTLGLSYRLTPSLTVNISGGPAITELGGETFISPAGSASLVQNLRIGTASVQYSRNVSTAGGFGGTTDTQTASGTLIIPAIIPAWRDLIVIFSPAYSVSESVSGTQAQQVSANVFTLNVGAAYRVSSYVNVFAGYSFLRQRTGGSSFQQVDADQSRVRVGLQFGYPFNFE
jgi:hypothetical protein